MPDNRRKSVRRRNNDTIRLKPMNNIVYPRQVEINDIWGGKQRFGMFGPNNLFRKMYTITQRRRNKKTKTYRR